MTNIAAAVKLIESQLAEAGGVSQAFVEVRDNGSEVILGGNRAGLLQIALRSLRLRREALRGLISTWMHTLGQMLLRGR